MQVTLLNVRDSVINIYRERKFLAATLKDTHTVVGRLELMIGVAVHLLFIFFYLLIFRVRQELSTTDHLFVCISLARAWTISG